MQVLSKFLLDGWMGGGKYSVWTKSRALSPDRPSCKYLRCTNSLKIFFPVLSPLSSSFLRFFPLLSVNSNSHLTGLFVNSEQVTVISLLWASNGMMIYESTLNWKTLRQCKTILSATVLSLFAWLSSYKPHVTATWRVLLVFPIYRWVDWSPNTTQLGAKGPQAPASNSCPLGMTASSNTALPLLSVRRLMLLDKY